MWPSPVLQEVEARPELEAARAQVGHQDQELHDDAEGGAQAEQQLLVGGVRTEQVLGRAEDDQVDHQHRDRDDVVGDRGPHHRPEPAACVEHLADEHEHPVEEDLRQAVAGEVDHRVPLGRHGRTVVVRGEEEIHQPRRRDHQHDRDEAEEERRERDDPGGVGLPAVLVVPHRSHQLWDEHGVDHAAGKQDVEHVRHGVGDVEDVGVQAVAEGRHEQAGADEAAHPRQDGPGRHHGAVGEDALPLVVGPLVVEGGHADFAAARIRRKRRMMIVPKSRATPVPRINQMTLLTRLERIGSESDDPSGVPSESVEQQRHVADSDRPGRRVEQDRRPGLRADLDVGVRRRDPEQRIRPRVQTDRHGLVERVGHGGREPAAAAGEDDRLRGRHADRAQPLLDPPPRARRGGTAGRRVPAVGVREVRHRLVAHDAADLVVEGEQVLEGVAGTGQAGGRREVDGVELGTALRGGVLELVG